MGEEKRSEPSRTSLELVSDTDLVIKRTFRAPAHIVFDAWTRPENLRRWWAPRSRGVTLVECEADVRPGGRYRYVLERSPIERYVFFGTYVEVARPTRVVYTSSFEPIPGEVLVTVAFDERDGATTLVAHEKYPSKAARDAAFGSGMEEGLRETIEQLDALVAELGA